MQLYSLRQITIGTFLGGPLNGAFLLFENFRNLNEIQRGTRILLSGFIILLIYFIISYYLPDKYTNGLGIIFQALNTAFATMVFHKYLKNDVEQHEAKKLPYYSNWRMLGITAVNVAIVIAAIFVFVQFETTPFEAELYDQKIEEYAKNEDIANTTFSLMDSVSNEGILIFINQEAMPALKRNVEITKELSYIQFLPEELVTQNSILAQINFKRIEAMELLQAYLITGADNIEAFNKKQAEIDTLIEQLSNE